MHVLLGLLVAFVVIVLIARSRAQKGVQSRACRWRADRSGDRGQLDLYRCAACGAEAYTATGGPPELCKDPRRV